MTTDSVKADSVAQAHATAPARGAWRDFPRECVAVIGFNTGVALLLWLLHFGGSFWQNWVFSQCIGVAITLAIDGGRRVLWGGHAPLGGLLVLVVLGGAGGLLAGASLGTALLGLPFSIWRPDAGHTLPIVLTIALVATGVGTYHGWSRTRLAQLREETAQQALREASAEKQLVRAQLQTLQAQLEPHFLFNVLANLDSLIVSDPARARVLLGHLNRFLRGSLSAVRAEANTLADEFTMLDALLAIQQVRFGDRLHYTFTLPADCRDVRVPPMLLQPLVENAIKHGIEPQAAGGSVRVTARRVMDERVELRVSDDGAGFSAAALASGSAVSDVDHGIGLTNVRARLRVLFGDDARLTLTEQVPHGVVATLLLPCAAAPAS